MEGLRPFDFATVASRRGVRNSGLKVGETVFVSSIKPLPEKRNDPYLQRIYVLCLRMSDEGDVLIPGEGNDHQQYLVDPRALEKVSEAKDKELKTRLEEIYKNETTD